MKKIGGFGISVVALAMVVGCGSSDDGKAGGAVKASSSAARARFGSGPTAKLTSGNAARVLSESDRQQKSGSGAMSGNPVGGSGSGTSTKSIGIRSLRILEADAENAVALCPDIAAEKEKGSCKCEGGGSFDYAIPNLKALNAASEAELANSEIEVSFTYDACVEGGKKKSGTMGMLLTKKSVVKVAANGAEKEKTDGTPSAGTGMNMLIVANDLTLDAEKLDFAFAMEGGKFFYAPSVDEGGAYVLTELSFDGSTKVHAQNGTFECSDDGATCKSDDGETIEVAE